MTLESAENRTARSTVSLAHGYHAESYPPQRAYDHGLRVRFAVIFHTYRPDKGSLHFDADLFLRVVSGLGRSLDHDSIEIWLNETDCVQSFVELERTYANADEDDREPPIRMELSCNGRLVMFVETEFWANCGGPAPYHDSYTASVYTADDHSGAFQEIAQTICLAAGATILEVHRGNAENRPYRPLWSMLQRLIS
jgi:hypothetical protein